MRRRRETEDDPAIVDGEIPALVALIRKLVGIDRKYTADEAGAIGEIAEMVGPASFWQHMDAAYRRELSAEETWQLAGTVTRKRAQKTILDSLRQLAVSDGIDPRELEIFDQLTTMWKLSGPASGRGPG